MLTPHQGITSTGIQKSKTKVARSSTMAEFRSITSTVANVEWVVLIFAELGVDLATPSIIKCNNLGATQFVVNSTFHTK